MKRLFIFILLSSSFSYGQSTRTKAESTVTKYSVTLDKNTKEKKVVEPAAPNYDENSFNYYYTQYLTSEETNKDYQSLLRAYSLNANYSELHFELAKYHELKNDPGQKKYFCQKLQASKLTPSLREYALNTLASVEPNGILITYGENDTYPIWVLQSIEGMRTDVSILNYDLLMNPSYRSRKSEELGLRFKSSYAQQIEILKDVAIKNPDKPIYFALTVSHLVMKDLKKNLFATGLALKYDKKNFDNLSVIKTNWETRFDKTYVTASSNPLLSQKMNINYLLPLIQLAKYYQENNMESQYIGIKKEILIIAKNAGREEQIKKMLND